MTIDLDIIIERGRFEHPFFAEFILNKYEDIKEGDPDGAWKIESRVFTPEFLNKILSGEDDLLKASALRLVPPMCFATLAEAVETYWETTDSIGAKKSAANILKTVAKDRFQLELQRKCREFFDQKNGTMEHFFWMEYLLDLPPEQGTAFFDETLSFFENKRSDLAHDERYPNLVQVLHSSAMILKHGSVDQTVREHLACLVDQFEEGQIDRDEFCFKLFHSLEAGAEKIAGGFELEVFYDMENARENGRTVIWSDALDRLYLPGPQGLRFIDSFEQLRQMALFKEQLEALPFTEQNLKKFEGQLVKRLIGDSETMSIIESANLTDEAVAAFSAMLWRLNRNEQVQPGAYTDEELVDYLCFDQRPLPFMARFHEGINHMPEERRLDILVPAMEKSLADFDGNDEGFYALCNQLELMTHAPLPDYLPLFLKTFFWEDGVDEDTLADALNRAVSGYGDGVFEPLSMIMDGIPKWRLLDVLSVIRKVATPKAEAFLLEHFDQFLQEYKADTMEACQGLVSQRALERFIHKVGKNQTGVDELFVLVQTFEGNTGPEVEKCLEGIRMSGYGLDESMALLESGEPRAVMTLELKCARCGDTSTYECSNIVVSRGGGAYVAEEKTCISCSEISEFDVTASGMMSVNGEMMRIIQAAPEKVEASPFQGAVRVLQTHAMGKSMGLSEAIAGYKEKIENQPGKAEFNIGLGNIYMQVNHPTFARQQYLAAIEKAPLYIEAYLSLAQLEEDRGNLTAALDWLEKGRPYLKRPLVCKDRNMSADQIMDEYLDRHFELRRSTGSKVAQLSGEECMAPGRSLKKIGPNEKCPCGSGKKFKKCCKGKM